MRRAVAIAAVLLPALAAAGAGDPSFDAHWHDGKAEIDGYRLTVSRYGETRTGQAVLVYVTEPFSESHHVKVDDPAKDPRDTVDALKLNLVRRFQTGIYDYHTMTSLFVRSADFSPMKVAFTGSEWCGQVYDEIHFRHGRFSRRYASYFEGESDDTADEVPANAVVEDDLFILLRGLRGEYLRAGKSVLVPLLQSPFYSRLTHDRSAWTTANIERSLGVRSQRVPAGTITAYEYVVTCTNGRVGRFWIERAFPHRVVRWTWRRPAPGRLGGDDAGELTGTTRAAYWTMQKPGDERALKGLGLTPVPR